MVSKCANPQCAVPFRYFHLGKLFRLEVEIASSERNTWQGPSRKIEFYWLCENCAATMTLVNEGRSKISVRSKRVALATAA